MPAHRLSYCAQQLRRFDNDRYLTALFAPAARREAIFALYAFNLEVARTAEAVSESLLGKIRLQWWRDALDGIYAGRPARHEVVAPLAEAVRRHGLKRAHFDRLIDAREFDLEDEAPATLAELEDYAEGTSSSLVQLALQVLGAEGQATETAGRHVGIAFALTGLLRAVPVHAGRKRHFLPQNLAEARSLQTETLFGLSSSAALCAVAEDVARRAGEHLALARAQSSATPKAALPALLPAVLAGQALATLRKVGYDPFDPRLAAQNPNRVFRLAWAKLRGRY
jgi:phytoene synthase